MVSIIIAAYNQHEMTEICINTILGTTLGDYEIVLVDNGSNPPIHLPFTGMVETKLIRNEENKGFPAAVNQGIREANGDIICLLNNDCIVTPGWFDKLLPYLDEFNIIGPVTNFCAGMQQVSADSYSTEDELFQSAQTWSEAMAGTDPKEVNWVIGFCMLFHAELFYLLGPFDESIWPANGEEIDFCLRAKKAGYKIAIISSVYVHHEGSKTFEDINKDHPYSEIIKKCDKHLIERWGKDVYNQEVKAGCNVHLVTLFSRQSLLPVLLEAYQEAGIIWHMLQFRDEGFIDTDESWVKPFIVPKDFSPDSMIWALNHFIRNAHIEDDDYYAMVPDDDMFEPGVLEKIKTFQNDIVVVSMKRGDNIPDDDSTPHGTDTLMASPGNMLVNHVGGEQLFLKGRIFKKYLYREDYYGADGLLAEQLKANEQDIRYEPNLYCLFNYFQLGRWDKKEIEIKPKKKYSYIIFSPECNYRSAGIRALHGLRQCLEIRGYSAVIYQSGNVPNDAIVVYPEIIKGNPLGGKTVVRLILNYPGLLGGDFEYDSKEILFTFSPAFYPGIPILTIPIIEDFFRDEGRLRSGGCFWIGKGENIPRIPETKGLEEITYDFPSTREGLASLFNQKEIFYSYDNNTCLIPEAQRCGCKVVVIPELKQGPTYDETIKDFNCQLEYFIGITQGKAHTYENY